MGGVCGEVEGVMIIPEPVWDHVAEALEHDPFWGEYWPSIACDPTDNRALHLGIFVEPFLRYILEGRKTIESRFSVHRSAPYQRASIGDIVLLKASGGPIVGVCRVIHVWFYELDPRTWSEIRNQFAGAMCAEGSDFWAKREAAEFATLLQVANVRAIEPVPFPKRDRRGWVVLSSPSKAVAVTNKVAGSKPSSPKQSELWPRIESPGPNSRLEER
jgi:hypothetical protein